MASRMETMLLFLGTLLAKAAEEYLADIGLSEEETAALKDNLSKDYELPAPAEEPGEEEPAEETPAEVNRTAQIFSVLPESAGRSGGVYGEHLADIDHLGILDSLLVQLIDLRLSADREPVRSAQKKLGGTQL